MLRWYEWAGWAEGFSWSRQDVVKPESTVMQSREKKMRKQQK